MKTRHLYARKTHMLLGIVAVTIMISFTSCSKKVYFQQSSVVPAAEGYVNVTRDNSENYVIQIELKNFAGAERLDPSDRTYVVWLVTEKGNALNIGRLSTTDALNASFKTISSFRPTKIFITAEEQEDAKYPGSMLVLSTDIF